MRLFNDVGVNLPVGTTPTGALEVRPKSNSLPVNVNGLAGHTVNLQEWRVNSGAALASVSSAGVGAFAGLTSAGNTVLTTVTGLELADFTAKGQILVATGSGTFVAVGVGADGTVLTAASGQASGVQWAAASGAGHTIKNQGTPLTARAGLNFGTGLLATDDAGNNETDVVLDLSLNNTWTGTGVTSFASEVRTRPASTSSVAFSVRVAAETVERFQIYGSGQIDWGDAVGPDTTLRRAGGSHLKTDDNFSVAGGAGIGTDFAADIALNLFPSAQVGTTRTIIHANSSGSATATAAQYGLRVVASTPNIAYTLTELSAIKVDTPTKGASMTLTSAYGVYVQPQSVGTAAYGARLDTAVTAALWLGGDAAGTAVSGGITFGSGRDVNIFRSAANTLNITATGTPVLQVGGSTVLVGSNLVTPAITLGTAAAAGASGNIIRSDATIAAFDATVPAALGAAATGAVNFAARRDHVHPTTGLALLAGGNTFSGAQTFGGASQIDASGRLGLLATAAASDILSIAGTHPGNAVSLFGVNFAPTFPATTTTEINALRVQVKTVASAFTVATAVALRVVSTSLGAGSAITNNYGIWVEPRTVGTSDYGVRIDSAQTQTLWLSGDVAPTTAAQGIAFGSARDTAVYRLTTNVLKVDTILDVATGYRVAGAATTGQYLRGNGTNFVSAAIADADLPSTITRDTEVVLLTAYTAKGAIIGGTGVGTAANVGAIGANNTVLMADSATATGMKWGSVAVIETVSNPVALGTAAPGAGVTAAAFNHVHPTTGLGVLASANTWANANTVQRNAIAAVTTDAVVLENATAATVGVSIQYSPRLRFRSHTWNTGGTPADNTHDWYMDSRGTTGTSPLGELVFSYVNNAGVITSYTRLTSDGMYLQRAGSSEVALRVKLTADTNARYQVYADGWMEWGTAASANGDVTLSRTGVGALELGGTLSVTGVTTTGGLVSTAGNHRVDAQGRMAMFGTAINAAVGMNLNAAHPGTATSLWGWIVQPTYAATTTVAAVNYYSQIKTAASAFTMATGIGFHAAVPALGASSAITTLVGLQVDDQGVAGVTNAYGLLVAAQAGAATLNIAARLDGGTQANLWLNSDTASVAGGIAFGTTRDIVLYRAVPFFGELTTNAIMNAGGTKIGFIGPGLASGIGFGSSSIYQSATNLLYTEDFETRDVRVNHATTMGSGVGIVAIANATTNPSTNPTNAALLYSDAGQLKWRAPTGITYWLGRLAWGTTWKTASALFTITSTTGVDWNAAAPLDVSFTKKGGSADTNMYFKIYWSGYFTVAGWMAVYIGLQRSAVNSWGLIPHQCNVVNNHAEFSDMVEISGLAAGAYTYRVVMKVIAGSQAYTGDVADFVRVEWEERPL